MTDPSPDTMKIDEAMRVLVRHANDLGSGCMQMRALADDGGVITAVIVLTGNPWDNARISDVVDRLADEIAEA